MQLKEKLVNEIINSIETAHKEYLEMSGDSWLWAGPEYFATVAIANQLKKIDRISYIDLEYSVRKTISVAGGALPGRPSNRIRINGRFDIVLWGKEKNNEGCYLPMCTIEVKNKVFSLTNNILLDFERLIRSIRSNRSSIKYAIFSYYTAFDSANGITAEQRIVSLIDSLKNKSEELAEHHECTSSCHKGKIYKSDDELSAWSAGAIVFQRTAKKKSIF
jgi:hypothetical protein